MNDNVIHEKSLSFAVRIVNLCKHLRKSDSEYILSKQILRSGTSVGAMVSESKYSESTADFIHKLSISLKEISEMIYWIKLLYATNYITQIEYESINKDAVEIRKILSSIIISSKNNASKDL